MILSARRLPRTTCPLVGRRARAAAVAGAVILAASLMTAASAGTRGGEASPAADSPPPARAYASDDRGFAPTPARPETGAHRSPRTTGGIVITQPAAGTRYTSQRPHIATVDADGKVTAHAVGIVAIDVENGKLFDQAEVTVESVPSAPSVPPKHQE